MNRRTFISTLAALTGIVLAIPKRLVVPLTPKPRLTATAAQIARTNALPLNQPILIGIGKPLSGKRITLDDAIYTRGKDGLYRRTT